MTLLEACLTVLRGRDEQPDEEAVYRPRIADLFRIPEALLRMRALVATISDPRPLEDFLPEVPAERRSETPFVRSAVASTFVAALELCRSAFVGLDQDEDFDTVMVYRPTQQPSNSEWFLQASAPHPAELPHAPSRP